GNEPTTTFENVPIQAKSSTKLNCAFILSTSNTYQPILNMPFFYNKSVGGRRFGTSIQADRHGVRRGPWRFRIGRFNCFK
ncbi:hypothetical protein BN1708_005128, partial [Verticillium longisporum]